MQGIYGLITSFLPAFQTKISLNQTMKHTNLTGFGQAFLLNLLLWIPLLSAGQGSGTIAGRIVDKGNQPIIGANVTVKGSTTGSATDLNGNYSIGSLKPGNITLDVSYLGYKTQSISVTVRSSGVTTANFTLTEDAQLLQEAVIVGYGTTQTRDLTGAVTAIPSKVFQQGNFSTPEQLVIGKTPGVRITNNSGLPGGGSVIRIRGGSSLNASNDPLIVIDGVPVDNGGIAGAANPLALINPEDIETFTVLKDASAAAIYGSRAANGVILITTKKGAASDRVRVELTTNSSAKQITRTVNVLDTAQLKQLGLLGLRDGPLTLPQLTRDLPHAPGRHQHQAQAHLGHGTAVDAGHVAHRHPLLSGSGQVDRVDAHANFLHQAQCRVGLDARGRDRLQHMPQHMGARPMLGKGLVIAFGTTHHLPIAGHLGFQPSHQFRTGIEMEQNLHRIKPWPTRETNGSAGRPGSDRGLALCASLRSIWPCAQSAKSCPP